MNANRKAADLKILNETEKTLKQFIRLLKKKRVPEQTMSNVEKFVALTVAKVRGIRILRG
jgi:hypothetical protein